MKDDISQIKTKLEGHQMSPSADSWAKIQSELREPKQQKMLLWKQWFAIAASLAIPLCFAIFLWFSKEEPHLPNERISKNIKIESPMEEQKPLPIEENPSAVPIKKIVKKRRATTRKTFASHYGNKASTKSKNTPSIDNSKKPLNTIEAKKERNTQQESRKEISKKTKKLNFKEPTNKKYIENKALQNKIISEPERKKPLSLRISTYAGISNLNASNLITENLDSFEKSNKSSFSYGAIASLNISNKLTIRSGIGIVNIKQETLDVPLTASISRGTELFEKNIEPYSNLEIKNTYSAPTEGAGAEAISGTNNSFVENISYELQFIEIPLEIEYQVFQAQKFEVATTTGLSALVKNKNELYLKQKDEALGKTTNINSLSLSANLGLKLNYNINENFAINVEPQMKYFMNTITKNNEAKPYTLGVSVGLSWNLNLRP